MENKEGIGTSLSIKHVKSILGLSENQINRYMRIGKLKCEMKSEGSRPYRAFGLYDFVELYMIQQLIVAGLGEIGVAGIFSSLVEVLVDIEAPTNQRRAGKVVVDAVGLGQEWMVTYGYSEVLFCRTKNLNMLGEVDLKKSRQVLLIDISFVNDIKKELGNASL